MMTEEEAKTKWCPFARDFDGADGNLGSFGGSVNRRGDGRPASSCRCIASQCMAWRSKTQTILNPAKGENPHFDVGYCGLAGMPKMTARIYEFPKSAIKRIVPARPGVRVTFATMVQEQRWLDHARKCELAKC